jgi:hypothetical protein
MTTYWIKLYTEILHDPKVNLMGEHLCWRMVQLFLLAGENNQDGILPPLSDMAWTLRVDAEQLETDMIELQRVGILVFDGVWIVRKFADRQAPADRTAAERMRQYRERQRALQVTLPLRVETETDTDTESDTEEERGAQILLETIVGLPAIPQDLPGIDELTRLGIQESDVRGALQWRIDNSLGPVKRLSQLFPGIKTEYSKRVQNGNARKNGSKPAEPDVFEQARAKLRAEGKMA